MREAPTHYTHRIVVSALEHENGRIYYLRTYGRKIAISISSRYYQHFMFGPSKQNIPRALNSKIGDTERDKLLKHLKEIRGIAFVSLHQVADREGYVGITKENSVPWEKIENSVIEVIKKCFPDGENFQIVLYV